MSGDIEYEMRNYINQIEPFLYKPFDAVYFISLTVMIPDKNVIVKTHKVAIFYTDLMQNFYNKR